jgi:acyl-coenzyme A thioesterase PaaI-like protein
MVAQVISRLFPAFDTSRNLVREAWNRLHRLPGGTRAFTRMIGAVAPYTGTIGAHVREVGWGHARVELPDRPRVRNHLRCIHAIALANLAELTGNVGLAYSLRDDQRFIVAGMSIEYLAKARGTITGESSFALPDHEGRFEVEVPVELRDARGQIVARATLRSLVGPKRSADDQATSTS